MKISMSEKIGQSKPNLLKWQVRLILTILSYFQSDSQSFLFEPIRANLPHVFIYNYLVSFN